MLPPVAVLRDARKGALLRTRLIDDIDMIRISETADLHPELLAQDAFVQGVAGVEQHVHGDAAFQPRLHRAHETHLVVIGDGGDRALFGFEHLDGDLGAVGQ